jgi:heat shock protein HslJ
MRLFRYVIGSALVLVPLTSCTTQPAPPSTAPAPSGDLAGTKWQLVHFQSMDDAIGTVTPPDPSRYTMELMPDGKLALQLDCNRAVGQWSAEPAGPTDGRIKLSAPAMTRAFCGEKSMDTRIARDLEFIVSYKLVADTLNLALKMDSGIYTWRRIP